MPCDPTLTAQQGGFLPSSLFERINHSNNDWTGHLQDTNPQNQQATDSASEGINE
jgi:hypothetical protein